jgi:hypothetical protein
MARRLFFPVCETWRIRPASVEASGDAPEYWKARGSSVHPEIRQGVVEGQQRRSRHAIGRCRMLPVPASIRELAASESRFRA